MLATYFLAHLHQLRGEAHSAQEQAESAIAIADDYGLSVWVALARMVRGWARVETVRSGSKEPAYLTIQLYTSAGKSTTGSGRPDCHRLPREPEERPIQALAHGVVVTVEDGLPLRSTPARNDVHRRSLNLGEIRFDA